MQNHKNGVAAMAAALVLLASGPAAAERTLNRDEVMTLFSDKTVQYYHERKDFDIEAYYAPDGSLRGKRGDKKLNATWSVEEHGSLCISRHGQNRCRIIVENNGVYKKYKEKGDGSRVLVITYRKFIDGNPKKY